MSIYYNLLGDLIEYFSTEDNPVSIDEFREFWDSLTYEQWVYYRTVDLQSLSFTK